MASKGLKAICMQYFETEDLYEVLNIDKKANEKEVKNGYRKMCLKVHPDRVEESEKEEATEKFKVLAQIHSILSDTQKRKVYDQTGDVEEDPDTDWTNYWKAIFKTVSLDDIQNYERSYKNSEEERNDVKEAYVNSEGNMDTIMDTVLFAQIEDEERLKDVIRELIAQAEVEAFEAFTKETKEKQKRRAQRLKQQRLAFERQHAKDKRRHSSSEDLQVALAKKKSSREKDFNNFFDALEQKYAKKGAGSKAKNGEAKMGEGSKAKTTPEPKKGARTSTRNK